MTPRRLLGAATAVLLTGTMAGHVPPAAAGDNDRSDWDDKRVAQTPGADGGDVHVLANRRNMVTVVRELGAGTDVWRIRESRDGSLGFKPRLERPRNVQRFRYDEGQLHDTTYAAYEHDGRLFAVEADAHRANGLTLRKDLAPAGAEAAKVAASEGDPDHGLITQAGTWHQHFGPVGGADPETTPNDGGAASRWVSYADPNLDGTPGNAGEDYAFANSGHLLVFWNAANGDLMVARRDAVNTSAVFSAAQTVAAGERYVDYVETAQGGRLVTQSTDGSVNLYAHTSDAAGFAFANKRVLAGALADAPEPQVLVDALATLTIGYRETDVAGGGLVLWQQDRPGSTFLERGNLVPGTRDSDARVVVSPKGSIAVALRRADETGIVRVKHLPAGKAKWTNGRRLISPKPLDTSGAWAIGSPRNDQDFRVVVNDRVGVYGFRFDAPRPYTKVTKPVRTKQKSKTYRVAWRTSWTFADDWSVRMRLDKGRRYGAWKSVNVNDSEQSKVVTRARGKTWCYSARARLEEGNVTPWSKQRCVTVRR
jgi:hypothetical protein